MTTWHKITKATGTSWNKITKPAAMSGTITGGTPIGLLLALTYSASAGNEMWTKVGKASGTSWTKITKPT